MGRVLTFLTVLAAASILGAGFAAGPGAEGTAWPGVASNVAAAPKAERVVISKEEFTLSVYGAGDSLIARYPVAVGENYGNKRRVGDHKTPEGRFTVQQIQNASGWTHDFGDGKGQIEGAYGSHFIRLLTPPHKGIGIHGTHDPASIGTRVTEGCIRLRNEDLLEFVKMVWVGLPVEITPSAKDSEEDREP